MYGIWAEERVFAAAAIDPTLGVLAPNPFEVLVKADNDFVEQFVLEVFVTSAVDGWTTRQAVLHTEGAGQSGHHGGGVVLVARGHLVPQEGCHVVLAVKVQGLLEVKVLVVHAWQLLCASPMLLPLVFPEVVFVPSACADVSPLGTKLRQQTLDLLHVKMVGPVAEQGPNLVVLRRPDPVDCPQLGRVVDGAGVLVAPVFPSQAASDWPDLGEHQEVEVVVMAVLAVVAAAGHLFLDISFLDL